MNLWSTRIPPDLRAQSIYHIWWFVFFVSTISNQFQHGKPEVIPVTYMPEVQSSSRYYNVHPYQSSLIQCKALCLLMTYYHRYISPLADWPNKFHILQGIKDTQHPIPSPSQTSPHSYLYDILIFLPKPHKGHSIAHPHGWAMECPLWVHSRIYIQHLS